MKESGSFLNFSNRNNVLDGGDRQPRAQKRFKVAFVFHYFDPESNKEFKENPLLLNSIKYDPLKDNPLTIWEIIPGKKYKDLEVTFICYGNEKSSKEQTLLGLSSSGACDVVVHVVDPGLKNIQAQYDSVKETIEASASHKVGHMVLRYNSPEIMGGRPIRKMDDQESNPQDTFFSHIRAIDFFNFETEVSIEQDEKDIGDYFIVGQLFHCYLLETVEHIVSIRKKVDNTIDNLASQMAKTICSEAIYKKAKNTKYQENMTIGKYQENTRTGPFYNAVKECCKEALSKPETFFEIQAAISEGGNIQENEEFITKASDICKNWISFNMFGGLKFTEKNPVISLENPVRRQKPLKVAVVYHCPKDINSEGEAIALEEVNPLTEWGITSKSKINNLEVTSVRYRYKEKSHTSKTQQFSEENDLVMHVVYPRSNVYKNGNQELSVKNAIKASASHRAGHMVLCYRNSNINESDNDKLQDLFFSHIPAMVAPIHFSDVRDLTQKKNIIGSLSDIAEQTVSMRQKTDKVINTLAAKMAKDICSKAIEKAYTTKYPNDVFDIEKYEKHIKEGGKFYKKVKNDCKDTLCSNPDTFLEVQAAILKEAQREGEWEKLPGHEDINLENKLNTIYNKITKDKNLDKTVCKVLGRKKLPEFSLFCGAIKEKFPKETYDNPLEVFLNELKKEMRGSYPFEQKGLSSLSDEDILQNIMVNKKFGREASGIYKEWVSFGSSQEFISQRFTHQNSLITLCEDPLLFPIIIGPGINPPPLTFLVKGAKPMGNTHLEGEGLPQQNLPVPEPIPNQIGEEDKKDEKGKWSEKVLASRQKQEEPGNGYQKD